MKSFEPKENVILVVDGTNLNYNDYFGRYIDEGFNLDNDLVNEFLKELEI